jgi:peptidyl-prolyl cis-trans isomerase C
MNAAFLKTLCKEPLLHFLLIGAALFGLQALHQPRQPEAPSARRIVISQGDIERLRLTWQMQWQRPPTVEEWQGLLEAHIREEVLYRQALALGLDRDDTVVRRRLAQKFEFLTQDLAASRPPPTPSWRRFSSSTANATASPRASRSPMCISTPTGADPPWNGMHRRR